MGVRALGVGSPQVWSFPRCYLASHLAQLRNWRVWLRFPHTTRIFKNHCKLFVVKLTQKCVSD